jgi:hypothetical protein
MPESRLVQLPLGLDGHERTWFEAFSVSVRVLRVAFDRLSATLEGAVGHISASVYPSAIGDAWTIVDVLHRARSLLWTRAPAFVSADAEFKASRGAFDALMKDFGELRNSVQHLDNELAALIDADTSVWGAISWKRLISIERFEMCALASTRMGAGTLNFGLTSVPTDGRPVSEIHLQAHGKRVSLSEQCVRLESVADVLVRLLDDKFSRDPAQAPEMVLGIELGPDGQFSSGPDGKPDARLNVSTTEPLPKAKGKRSRRPRGIAGQG